MQDQSEIETLGGPTVLESRRIDFNRLRCEACNRKIVHLLVTPPREPASATSRPHRSSEPISYRAECPFCGDRSKPERVVGSVCPVPEEGVMIVDVEMDADKAYIRTIKR